MAARYVVDTNVLVYALDRREPEKRERAREVLRRVGGAGIAALPAQVLSEFGLGRTRRRYGGRSSASCSPSRYCCSPAPWC
jgi:predicted nucleic acid-binding protein